MRLALCPCFIAAFTLGAAAEVRDANHSPEPLREEVFVRATPLDRIEISFVVRDRGGSPVTGLGADDFRLKVDGAPTLLERVVGTKQASDVPLSIVFLIDVSRSMASIDRERFLGGASALLGRLRSIDEMMLVTFTDEPRVVGEFSSDPVALSTALETVARPAHGTNIARALETAEDRLSVRPGRGVVVLYSDGFAQAGGIPTVPVYWIVPHFQGIGAVRSNDGLRNLVIASGGRLIFESRGIESALDEVGVELSARYEAAFYVGRAKHRRRPYAIELEALRPGATVQAPRFVERIRFP